MFDDDGWGLSWQTCESDGLALVGDGNGFRGIGAPGAEPGAGGGGVVGIVEVAFEPDGKNGVEENGNLV